MSGIIFSLSSPEDIQRMRDLAEAMIKLNGGLTANLRRLLDKKVHEFGVHRLDMEDILKELTPFSSTTINENCPVCQLDLPQPILPFCPKCAWDLKNDIIHCPSLEITDAVLESYSNQITTARKLWQERVDVIKRQHESEEELKREKQRRFDEEQRRKKEQDRLEANRREIAQRERLKDEEDRRNSDEAQKRKVQEEREQRDVQERITNENDGTQIELITKKPADKTEMNDISGQLTQATQERITNAIDGTQLVLISEGEFLAGGPEMNQGSGQPFLMRLPAYYLALYPVTNIQYARFLSRVKPSKNDLEKYVLLNSDCFVRKAGSRYEAYGNKNDHPVVMVSWHGAKAYAKWAGLRLPSELEWEKGARGVDGRKYPWGNTWDETNCRNDMNRGNERTCIVQSYPDGRSMWGLYQMSGNIWEWCEDRYDHDVYGRYRQGMLISPTGDGGRVLRGGSWNIDNPERFCGASRYNDIPVGWRSDRGFRLARNVTLSYFTFLSVAVRSAFGRTGR